MRLLIAAQEEEDDDDDYRDDYYDSFALTLFMGDSVLCALVFI